MAETVRKMSPAVARDILREQTEEVCLYYRPTLERFVAKRDDAALMGELGYWANKVGLCNRLPDDRADMAELLERMLGLRHDVRRGGRLTTPERQQIMSLCIYLRGLIVPLFPGPRIRPQPLRMPDSIKEVLRLKYQPWTDWELIQRLACRVSSVELELFELDFIAHNWKEAWLVGPNHFSIGQSNTRLAALDLYASFEERPAEFLPEQARKFKKLVGFIERVPLWEAQPAQLDLLTARLSLADSYSAPQPKPAVVPRQEPEPNQLSFWDVFARPWHEFLEQGTLFGDPVPPPASWDGEAHVQELF